MKKLFSFIKSKIFVVALILTLTSTVTVFGYWASVVLTNQQEENLVVVGEGETATVSVDVSDTLGSTQLVPTGQSANSIGNPVEEVTFTFTILWEDNREGITDGLLNVIVTNVQNDPNELIVFTYDSSTPIEVGTPLVLTVVVTMLLPANQTEYEQIINANVLFDVNFTVVPN